MKKRRRCRGHGINGWAVRLTMGRAACRQTRTYRKVYEK
jgi:hypothetical protein